MKALASLLLLAALVSAADKRYSVCIVGAGEETCTKALDRATAAAVLEVFAKAPIGGLDAVYIYDTKGKNKTCRVVPAQQLPTEHPGITPTPVDNRL